MTKGRAMLVLTVNPEHISVTLQDKLWDIGLTLKVIAETLHRHCRPLNWLGKRQSCA